MSLLKNVPDFSQEITIVINEDDPELSRKFTITQGLLVEHSAFFEAACHGEWKEATTRTIKIPDVNNDTFYAYLYWIHREQIPFDTDCNRNERSTIYEDTAHLVLDEIIKLWLLADRLMTAKLRNAAVDAILHVIDLLHEESVWDKVFPASTINLIWSATTRNCAIRRIVIDFYAHIVQSETIKNNIEGYHIEFVKDLAIKSFGITHNVEKDRCPTENQEQQPGYYHELDKPYPRGNIYGMAEIDLKDKDGIVYRYQSTLFATPQEYINAANDNLGSYHAAEVKVQIKNEVWAVVKPESWSESFGKIAESSHLERVSIGIIFDECSFPEELDLPGRRL